MQEQVTPKQPSKKTSPELQSASTFAARTTLTLECALGLYSMSDSESFWEVDQDTRCLIGWGNNTVVVAFRGTASMRNALADMQVLAYEAFLSCYEQFSSTLALHHVLLP